MYSLFIDPCNFSIRAVEKNDLTGNTDWIRVDLNAQDAEALTPLFDERGAPLYKLIDGAIVERTDGERMSEWRSFPEPTEPDRITALESVIEAQARALEALGVIVDA